MGHSNPARQGCDRSANLHPAAGGARMTTRAGRDIIDHACGAHDDRANAVAGVVAELAKRRSDQVFGLLSDGDELSPRHRMAWAGAAWV